MNRSVTIVLVADVPNLGSRGDICTVALGYAKNYLIPRGLAELATAGSLGRAKRSTSAREAEEQRRGIRTAEIRDRLRSLRLVIHTRCNEHGKCFGSVGKNDISRQLAASGVTGIPEQAIQLNKKIDAVGDYVIGVQIGTEAVTFSLTVKPEQSPSSAAGQ